MENDFCFFIKKYVITLPAFTILLIRKGFCGLKGG